jgi:hypothetical protein
MINPSEIDHDGVDYNCVFERSWDHDSVPRYSSSSETPYIIMVVFI